MATDLNLVARLCLDFLGPDWACLEEKDIDTCVVEGGLTNRLCKCTHPSVVAQPNTVLVRLYNGDLGELSPRETDVMVYSILAERGVAPPLYGALAGVGRIEGWIPNSAALKTAQLADGMMSLKIARAMAAFHQQTLPLAKNDSWLYKALHSSLQAARAVEMTTSDLQASADSILSRDFEVDIDGLKKLLQGRNMKVVVCHNDLQEGNIMNSADGVLHLIDFEYTAYNYAAFDIANHFAEWMFCYDVAEAPHFWYEESRYPSLVQQRCYIEAYLQAQHLPHDSTAVHVLLADVVACSPAAHLLWALWAVQNANTPIAFGYLEFAAARMAAYDAMSVVAKPSA